MVPEGARTVPNTVGTAPGLWLEKNERIYIIMPGVPFEMKEMMQQHILPELKKRFAEDVLLHKTVLTTGAGESKISEMIEPWLDEFAEQLKAEAMETSLDEVALSHDLDLISVSSTPYNAAQSSYMADLSYTDPAGMLSQAASSSAVALTLYTSAEETLLDPIKVGSSLILVETGTDEKDEGMGSYITMFYDYLSGSQNQQDFTQALYTSENHQNDFLSTFFSVVLGQ